jgi:hypothetical protein
MRNDVDAYEKAVEEAIEICGGDVHGAIKALIMANEYLEAQLRAWSAADVSHAVPAGTLH